jgi:hypothetical protein
MGELPVLTAVEQRLRLFPLLLMPWLAAAAPGLNAQAPASDSLRVLRVDAAATGSFRLDGRLDEPFWNDAAPLTDFRQLEPTEGEPASEATEVRLVVDDATVYVGIRALDGQPTGVVGRILQRDKILEVPPDNRLRFAGDDAVAILFDAFHDHRNGVIFATNPNGAEFDALLTDEGRQLNVSWRAVWDVRAQRTDEGWTAEMAIPLRTLRYPAGGDAPGVWGFNVWRMIRRKNEEVLWRSWSQTENEGFMRVSRAGHLVGMSALPDAGLNVEGKPYALAGVRQDVRPAPGTGLEAQRTTEVGLDLKSEVVPGLTLDLTLNTDFAQVEADQQQVNLTRFSLFFPEKRDFFLENAGIFDFGFTGPPGMPPPLLAFFSRQIGIADGGEVPIRGGARLTGRAGEQTIGLINVVTGPGDSIPGEVFSVARVKRDVGSSGYIGALVTDRRSADASNTVGGVDGTIWLSGRLNFQGFLVGSRTVGEGGDDIGYRASLMYNTDRLSLFAQHFFFGDELRVGSGFLLRDDQRFTGSLFRYRIRPRFAGLRFVDFMLGTRYITREDGTFADWGVHPNSTANFNTGDGFQIGFNPVRERVEREFRVSGRLPVPADEYGLTQYYLNAFTSPGRAISAKLNFRRGDFYGGRLFNLGGEVTGSLTPRLTLTAGYNRNAVTVPSGDFTADVSFLRGTYAFSTRFTTDALLQYNSLERRVLSNVRLNLIHRPGSDLFVVFTEDRGREGDLGRVSNRGLVSKVTYLMRF